MPIDLSKYRKPASGIDLSKYRKPTGPFRFNQPDTERQNRITEYKAEAAASAEDAKKANSVGGFFKNFGKAIVETIAPSEVGLGRSIAAIASAGNKPLQAAHELGTGVQADLLQRIREKKARGEDTTRLEQAYNVQAGQTEKDQKALSSTNLPSNTKVLAQVAGTGLDLLTAGTYGRASAGAQTGRLMAPASKAPMAVNALRNVASSPAGLFTAKGASRVAVGAGTGYAYDVTQGLQGERGKEREGVKALIPGLGTALGAGVPAVAGIAQSIKGATPAGRIEHTVAKRGTALADLEKKYRKVDVAFKAADKKGIDARRILAETDILNGAVDADGMISSEKALGNFDDFIAPYEGKVREALAKEGRKMSVPELAQQADDFMRTSKTLGNDRTQVENAILAELQAFTKDNPTVPLTSFHDRKVQLGSRNNYLDPDKNAINKEVTRFFKEIVERNTKAIDAQNFNGELSKYYSIRDVLEALDRTRVKGGRLGKYFASVVGGAAGGAVGGPVGVIFGAEAGAAAKGAQMSGALGGKLSKTLQPSQELITALGRKATGNAAVPEVRIPGTRSTIPEVRMDQSRSSGSRNTPQATKAIIPIRKSIDSSVTPRQANDAKVKAIFGDINPVARFHPEDRAFIEEMAFKKTLTADDKRIIKQTLEGYGAQIPSKGIQEFLRDILQSDFDRSINNNI